MINILLVLIAVFATSCHLNKNLAKTNQTSSQNSAPIDLKEFENNVKEILNFINTRSDVVVLNTLNDLMRLDGIRTTIEMQMAEVNEANNRSTYDALFLPASLLKTAKLSAGSGGLTAFGMAGYIFSTGTFAIMPDVASQLIILGSLLHGAAVTVGSLPIFYAVIRIHDALKSRDNLQSTDQLLTAENTLMLSIKKKLSEMTESEFKALVEAYQQVLTLSHLTLEQAQKTQSQIFVIKEMQHRKMK